MLDTPYQTFQKPPQDNLPQDPVRCPEKCVANPKQPLRRNNRKDDPRRIAMERYELKLRLIRDAKALGKLRKITQGQRAEELGLLRSTFEE